MRLAAARVHRHAERSRGNVDPRLSWWDSPTMVVTLDAKRRLTVPSALVPTKPGDVFEVEFDAESDSIVFRRLAPGEDWLAVVEQCPVPIDDLPRRRRQYFRPFKELP